MHATVRLVLICCYIENAFPLVCWRAQAFNSVCAASTPCCCSFPSSHDIAPRVARWNALWGVCYQFLEKEVARLCD